MNSRLNEAIIKGDLEKVKELLRDVSNINIRNEDGETLLHIVSKNGRLNILKHLITLGAGADIQDGDGNTPLHIASMEGHFKIVKYLVDHGANINVQNVCGDTPLHIESLEGHFKIVKYLVDHGANINVQNVCGDTPLHIASLGGYLKIVEYLVDHGAKINIQDEEGDTPLHCASLDWRLNVVKYLISKGADLDILNYNDEIFYDFLNKDHIKEIDDHIFQRLFKIVFMISNKLQRKYFGLLPLENILSYYFRESDVVFLEEYACDIFDVKSLNDEKYYNVENIIAIIISIATQEEYMKEKILKESDIPKDYVRTIKEYITKKF